MEYDDINKDELNPNATHVHAKERRKHDKVKGFQHCL